MLRRWRSLLVTRRGEFFPTIPPRPVAPTTIAAFTEPSGPRPRAAVRARRGVFFALPIPQLVPPAWIEPAGARPRVALPFRRGEFLLTPLPASAPVAWRRAARTAAALPPRRGDVFAVPVPLPAPQVPAVPAALSRARPLVAARRDGQFFPIAPPPVGPALVSRPARVWRRVAPARRVGAFFPVPALVAVPLSSSRRSRPAAAPRRDGQFFAVVPAPQAQPQAVLSPRFATRPARPLLLRRDGVFFALPPARTVAPSVPTWVRRSRPSVVVLRRGDFWTVTATPGRPITPISRRSRPSATPRRDGQFWPVIPVKPPATVPGMVRADTARLLPTRRGRFQPVPQAPAQAPAWRRASARPRPLARPGHYFRPAPGVPRTPWTPDPVRSRRPRLPARGRRARFGRITLRGAGLPYVPPLHGDPYAVGLLHAGEVAPLGLLHGNPAAVGLLHAGEPTAAGVHAAQPYATSQLHAGPESIA